jgi:hypothetical protein
MILSCILFAIAAILNAVMDTLVHHYSTSVFKNLSPKFWNPNISWQYNKFLGMAWDGWHIAKTLMLICLVVIPSFNPSTIPSFYQLFFLTLSWAIPFNLFYSVILRRR